MGMARNTHKKLGGETPLKVATWKIQTEMGG
jgi:hypothetical protein